MQNIKDFEDERDSRSPVDREEIMAHVKNMCEGAFVGNKADLINQQETDRLAGHENTKVAPKKGESKADTYTKAKTLGDKAVKSARDKRKTVIGGDAKNPINNSPMAVHNTNIGGK